MISSIILGAGESSRFGTPKVLFKINNKSFLELILDKLKNIDEITERILILGYNYNEIEKQIPNKQKLKILINKNYSDGQLSSFKTGVTNINSKSKGILMILVDHPFVALETYSLLIKKFIESNYTNIIIPVYNGRKGHPVIFPAPLKNEILNAPLNEGARFIVHKYNNLVKLINVNDKYILADIDYKKDLDQWKV